MAAKFGKVSNSKLVLLGDSAVGKSSVVERFVKNEFFQYQVRSRVADCWYFWFLASVQWHISSKT